MSNKTAIFKEQVQLRLNEGVKSEEEIAFMDGMLYAWNIATGANLLLSSEGCGEFCHWVVEDCSTGERTVFAEEPAEYTFCTEV